MWAHIGKTIILCDHYTMHPRIWICSQLGRSVIALKNTVEEPELRIKNPVTVYIVYVLTDAIREASKRKFDPSKSIKVSMLVCMQLYTLRL